MTKIRHGQRLYMRSRDDTAVSGLEVEVKTYTNGVYEVRAVNEEGKRYGLVYELDPNTLVASHGGKVLADCFYSKEDSLRPYAPKEQDKPEVKEDPITPKHYKGDLVMRICEYFGLCACLMNVTKYVLRAGEKVGDGETKEQAQIRDLKKAQWYLERKIMQLEGNPQVGKMD